VCRVLLGLIFVVDSNDRERVGEARQVLARMLGEDKLREAVLLVFANKQVSIVMNGRAGIRRTAFLSYRSRSYFLYN